MAELKGTYRASEVFDENDEDYDSEGDEEVKRTNSPKKAKLKDLLIKKKQITENSNEGSPDSKNPNTLESQNSNSKNKLQLLQTNDDNYVSSSDDNEPSEDEMQRKDTNQDDSDSDGKNKKASKEYDPNDSSDESAED